VPHVAHGSLALLRRAPDFRRLFLATLGSGAGTYLAAVALTVDIFDRTGSNTWVSALLIAEFLPIVVLGVALGGCDPRISGECFLGVFFRVPQGLDALGPCNDGDDRTCGDFCADVLTCEPGAVCFDLPLAPSYCGDGSTLVNPSPACLPASGSKCSRPCVNRYISCKSIRSGS